MILNGPTWKLFFEQRHQAAIAIVSVCLLLSLFIHLLNQRIFAGPHVDLDLMPVTPAQFLIDLNSADWPELMVLPGIGEKLAQAIVLYRHQTGPFTTHEELLGATGIGPNKLFGIKPHLLPLATRIEPVDPIGIQ